MFFNMMKSPARGTVTMTAVVAAALVILAPVRADDLDPARAKLAEIKAWRASHDAAPAAAPAPAPVVAVPAAPAPAKGADITKSTGPGRPELKTSGTFAYLGNPFMKQTYRVIMEDHALQVGDRIRGAKIVKITDKDVTLTKDGDTWTLPAFTK